MVFGAEVRGTMGGFSQNLPSLIQINDASRNRVYPYTGDETFLAQRSPENKTNMRYWGRILFCTERSAAPEDFESPVGSKGRGLPPNDRSSSAAGPGGFQWRAGRMADGSHFWQSLHEW